MLILAIMRNNAGAEYVEFNGTAMYWAVKKMTQDLINDSSIIENAIKLLDEQRRPAARGRTKRTS